jgi:hypothetical protein
LLSLREIFREVTAYCRDIMRACSELSDTDKASAETVFGKEDFELCLAHIKPIHLLVIERLAIEGDDPALYSLVRIAKSSHAQMPMHSAPGLELRDSYIWQLRQLAATSAVEAVEIAEHDRESARAIRKGARHPTFGHGDETHSVTGVPLESEPALDELPIIPTHDDPTPQTPTRPAAYPAPPTENRPEVLRD